MEKHGDEIRMLEPVVALDAHRYLKANPDVAAAGMDALHHYENYGREEGRRQFTDSDRVQIVRERKLARVAFNRESQKIGEGALDFISSEMRNRFSIPDFHPVAENDYSPEIVSEIRSRSGDLFLDVGAGFRHVYYPNVINVEVWAAESTDVVCLAEDLPFVDEQFDGAFCLAVLEHTKQPWKAAQEILRVLKPGGTLHIDWPFLQPVHGYPHHYYNATYEGTISMFADSCEIISAEVRPWQHPIFSLHWILEEWAAGLTGDVRCQFGRLSIDDLLQHDKEALLQEAFCRELPALNQSVIAAGTTLLARKR